MPATLRRDRQAFPDQLPLLRTRGNQRNAGARGPRAGRAWPPRTVWQRGSALAGTQGCSEAATMLPSLQESLDGDEKELESSEEGGSTEEQRKLEPPPSTHYCLYSYRGSRCSVQQSCGPALAAHRHLGFAAWPLSNAIFSQPRVLSLRALLASWRSSGPPSGTFVLGPLKPNCPCLFLVPCAL